jgi:hypothetical protein
MESLCFCQSIEEPLLHEFLRGVRWNDNLIETSVSSGKGIKSHVLPLSDVEGRIISIERDASCASDEMEESPLIIWFELTDDLPEHDHLLMVVTKARVSLRSEEEEREMRERGSEGARERRREGEGAHLEDGVGTNLLNINDRFPIQHEVQIMRRDGILLQDFERNEFPESLTTAQHRRGQRGDDRRGKERTERRGQEGTGEESSQVNW